MRELGVNYWEDDKLPREQLAAASRRAGAQRFEPWCWFEHIEAGERPLDWTHTLAALYRVRCNLFHGEKARRSENDQAVVQAAFAALLSFLEETRYQA